jgi:hypothetical protein
VTFGIEWDPLAFVKEQEYREKPDEAVEIAITLTGPAKDAQALTCAQYLCQTCRLSKPAPSFLKYCINYSSPYSSRIAKIHHFLQ